MKKVLILQNNGNNYGGVWQVNKLVGEELIKNNYDVSVVSIREDKNDLILKHDSRLKLYTINKQDGWGTYKGYQMIEELKKGHLLMVLKMIFSRIKYNIGMKKDIKKLHNYIYENDPDYIIVSHYQLLDMIPKMYLVRTINEQHTSFEAAMEHKGTIKTLNRYKDKVKFVWLSENTMKLAIENGFRNSTYIYNAVRFKSNKKSNVVKNKKLIAITRISAQKNIKLMIEILEEIFKLEKYHDWVFELYGSGPDEESIRKMITNKKQIKLMGVTNDSQEKLLTASINLNTSLYEGFSLTILEANECGVPTITFNFGESVTEEIINNKTGIIAKNRKDYINNLMKLMDDSLRLEKMSLECQKFSQKFQIEEIIKDWINVFYELDKYQR